MTLSRLDELSADPTASFVLIARDGADTVELLTGAVTDVELLSDIPLTSEGEPREVFALVPYRQVRERGFVAQDDGAPLRCIVVDEHLHLPTAAVLDALPTAPIPLRDEGFDIADEEYAAIVETVIADEIGRGEGANFVIRRDFTATVEADERQAAPPGSGLCSPMSAGPTGRSRCSPRPHRGGGEPGGTRRGPRWRRHHEPHLGTFRHPAGGATKETLTDFLASTKETEELFMVVDEELKMMSAVCADGGRITGPHLKEMSRLTHTEYMLRGRSALDPGTSSARRCSPPPSPAPHAERLRRDPAARAQAAGLLLRRRRALHPNADGGHDLDAPILIRTVYLQDGELSVPVGATLVRHSDPHGEVSETHGKAAGVLGAIGAIDRDRVAEARSDADAPGEPRRLADDPDVAALLSSRNARLAEFWLNPQGEDFTGPFSGRSALVVDAEDRFTTMLAHQLRHLGLDVTIASWDDVDDEAVETADLVVAGPGPGDPRDDASPRIARMREVVAARLQAHAPLLAVCLSHQILADRMGIALTPLDAPHQGLQKAVPIFGEDASIGFYNTFTARVDPGTLTVGAAEVSADPATGDVYALRGDGFASVQGHLESILSRDGIRTLERLVAHALR